ncbi:hypothetical protein [Micromonospora sp. NPDC050200]|uniref:hypothetical protein n=1 Tax=Micromonospora sp. NPDC050200 TaxID=3155664 RepID=UPI0033C9BC00
MTESDVLSCAGVPAQVLPAENVTYVIGPSATLVIVQAGDQPDGNAVQSFDDLALREPFPEAAAARLSSSEPPLLGFVRVPEGYVPLGKLWKAVSQHKPISTDGSPWLFGGIGELTWCRLRIAERLPFDVLDQVRPTPQQPLPSLDWLRFLPHDPVAAVRDFLAGWYADIPPGDDGLGDQDAALPESLLAFYQAAAGRREVFGLHNQIYTAGELEYEDDGRVQFGTENQGVFAMLLAPTEADPAVQYDGLHAEQEREPLSAFLLQFLLCEASYSSPFTGFATVTAEQARLLVEPLHRVPLQPMRWPGDPTHHYVAEGLVVTTAAAPDGSTEVYVGSRCRSALRSLRDPGFGWERFDA